jgi:hypothetical protein
MSHTTPARSEEEQRGNSDSDASETVDREEALEDAYVETNRVSPLDPRSIKSWLGLE